jgi:hypothetical protein
LCYQFDIESGFGRRLALQKTLQHLIERRSFKRHSDSGFQQCLGVLFSMSSDEITRALDL